MTRGATARRLWILLLLTAVFSMHGVAALAGPLGADSGAAAAAHRMVAVAPASVIGPAAADEPSATAMAAGGTMAAERQVLPDVPHDVLEHLWAACLAVLLAGVALMVVAAAVRRATPSVPKESRRHAPLGIGWITPARPPDLSVLCLLRI